MATVGRKPLLLFTGTSPWGRRSILTAGRPASLSGGDAPESREKAMTPRTGFRGHAPTLGVALSVSQDSSLPYRGDCIRLGVPRGKDPWGPSCWLATPPGPSNWACQLPSYEGTGRSCVRKSSEKWGCGMCWGVQKLGPGACRNETSE